MEYRYFDNAATTRICDRALEAYEECSRRYFANPSSRHVEGRESRELVTKCRQRIASVLSVQPQSLFFTSGATESIGLVMSSLLWAKRPGRILISSIEHEAVSSWAPILTEKGWKVETLSAPGGFVSPEELERKLDRDVRLVAIMSVNNVLGTVQDTKNLVRIVREKEKEYGRPIFYFADSVQALGKTDFSLKDLDVDGASFSGHKIHGPRGIGLLYLKKGQLQVLSHGGGQEGGIRGGTENTPAIAALAAAFEELEKEDREKITAFNRATREVCRRLSMPVLTPEENSTPYILSVVTKYPSEVALRMLQDLGCLVSSGSACSANERGKAEALLRSAGFGKYAGNTIRISFSRDNTMDDVEVLSSALEEINA